MNGLERQRLVREHYRDGVLHVDIRSAAVVGDRAWLIAKDDLTNSSGVDRLFL